MAKRDRKKKKNKLKFYVKMQMGKYIVLQIKVEKERNLK